MKVDQNQWVFGVTPLLNTKLKKKKIAYRISFQITRELWDKLFIFFGLTQISMLKPGACCKNMINIT